MKKIIFSLAMIAAVAAIVVGATTAFFNDRETSTGNTFAAGTIDISVDGENPWTTNWHNYLDKPCQTNYMNFVIKNEGENPARVWKKLTNITNEPGEDAYCGASSEPEYVDGGGEFGPGICENGNGLGQGYVERDNLSAFIIYDMAICEVPANEYAEEYCPMVPDESGDHFKPDLTSDHWQVLIDEADQVRVDNVADTWMKLTDELPVGASLVVSQSYHLMTWDDSGQPVITNWAQGDIMTFDIELEARQLTAPAPGVDQNNMASASLVQKNTTTWDPVPGGAAVTLNYSVSGETFTYDFSGTVAEPGDYQLIYYPDPWTSPKTVVLIGGVVTSSGNNISGSGDVELNTDLPAPTDANFGVGAKVWLVPTNSLSGDQLSWTNLNRFLFDASLVNYDDTGV